MHCKPNQCALVGRGPIRRRLLSIGPRSMSGNWSYFVLLLLTVAALAGLWCKSRWAAQQKIDEPLEQTEGRLQLVVDDQDVGLVRQGTQLDVHFAVANVGTDKLLLRQAPREGCVGETLPRFSGVPCHA